MLTKYYKVILDDLPYPIMIWNYGGSLEQELDLSLVTCTWINKNCQGFVEKDKKKLIIGKNILEITTMINVTMKPDIAEKLIVALKEVYKTGARHEVELNSDKLKVYNIKVNYLYETYFYSLIDIKDKENIKNDYNFLSNISHEIRTPLNGIIGITSLLADTTLTQEQGEYLEILKQSGYNLMAIINDILDATKLELHKIALNEASFYLRDCIESSFDIISSMASKKQLTYDFDIKDNVPDYIIGDYQRLRQIMVNLLSNAVKFTKKGSIHLSVSLKSTERSEGSSEETVDNIYHLYFQVIDTGIGIAKKDMNKLFKPFTQIDQTTTKEYEGTGLGLVISKQLCELMRGKIWCESVLGQGSTFTFTIKARGYTTSAPQVKRRDLNLDNLKGKKVLIVDDKEENRTYLQITLYKLGIHPYLFASAEEALTFIKFNKIHFDLGLIDICMPRMDGNTFALELKKKNIPVPLIALSSLGDKSETNTLFANYLLKPIHEDKLIQTMYSIFTSPTDKCFKTERSNPHGCISILVAEDIYLNQRVILGILNKLGFKNVDMAENGKQVLDKLAIKKYDLIFMDIKMPIMDGNRAIHKIHKLYGAERPKIIALTAVVTKGDKEKYTTKGYIDGYLVKPIDIEMMNKELERIFKAT